MLMRIQCQIAAVLLRSWLSMGTERWSAVFGACETTILWLVMQTMWIRQFDGSIHALLNSHWCIL